MTIAQVKEDKDVHQLLVALGNTIRLFADDEPVLQRVRREFRRTVKDKKIQRKGL